MQSRDHVRDLAAAFTDETLCELFRIADCLTELDHFGSGRSGPAGKGGISDRVGAMVARHAGGTLDEKTGATTPDTWDGERPHPTLVDVLFVVDQLEICLRSLRKARQRAEAVLNRKDRHEAARGASQSTCTACGAPISGNWGDSSHGGLCEVCHRAWEDLPTPRPSIVEWTMAGGKCIRCGDRISGAEGDRKRDGLCPLCWAEYAETEGASVEDWIRRGGRCDCCDKMTAGSEADKLRPAGDTGERYCMTCYQRRRRSGSEEGLRA